MRSSMDEVYRATPGAESSSTPDSNDSYASDSKISPELERGPRGLPRIPIDLYEHKVAIAIHWVVLVSCSCFLPVGMYFILKYAAHAKGSVVIGVSSAIFGAVSLPALFIRTWSLAKPNSTTRPTGTSRWTMDYFNWNFMVGFIYITIVIVISTVLVPARPRIAALPLSLLLFQVCLQLLAAQTLMALDMCYPFRFSSMAKGEKLRPALYSIVEDVVAVDGGQGTRFREAFSERYLASKPMKRLLREMDLLWGISGVVIAVVAVVLIWELHDVDAAWVVGWTVPWVWAAICTLITAARTKSALANERLLKA